jgi:sugar lactone lactonase YvrE
VVPVRQRVVQPDPQAGRPTPGWVIDITAGPDGNLWFTEQSGNRIGRITPHGAITEFANPTPASQPRAIALGADGNIWFGEFAGGKVGRITPQGAITEFALPTPNSGPRALAAGPDGNIWVSQYRASRIARITPGGEITEFALPRPNSGPGDITAGPDGAMWFVELSGNMDGMQPDGARIGRIAMDGTVTEFEMPTRAPSPARRYSSGSAEPMRSWIISVTAGSRSVWPSALLSLATTSGGVPAGATIAQKNTVCTPGNPISAKVGTFGSPGKRAGPATASGLACPRNM